MMTLLFKEPSRCCGILLFTLLAFSSLIARHVLAQSEPNWPELIPLLEKQFEEAVKDDNKGLAESIKKRLDLNTVYNYATAYDEIPEVSDVESARRQELMRRATCLTVEINHFIGSEAGNILWDGGQYVPMICRRVSQAEVDRAKADRDAAFTRQKESLEKAIESQSQTEIDIKITQLKESWPKIVESSFNIYFSMDRSSKELKHQRKLLDEYAALIFKAKNKSCNDTQVHTYVALENCVGVFYEKGPSSCPPGFDLYEGTDGNLYCDCFRGEVYFNDECARPSDQGSCNEGEWVQLNNERIPECQPIPAGCKLGLLPWQPDPHDSKVICGVGWEQGPCPVDWVLFRGYKGKVACAFDPPSGTLGYGAPMRLPNCPDGSHRDQQNACKTSA